MAKVQIISPIKVIKSGTAPTTSNLSEGEMAVGEVTDNFQDGITNPPRIFFRAGNKIYDPIGDVRYTAGEALVGLEALNEMVGTSNGIAQLDASGKVPSAQLPSYVDDVLEFDNKDAFPNTGESGKIYIAIDTNKSYRWGGSVYAEISSSLALGSTSSTAFPGDRGAAAESKAQSAVQTVSLSASTSDEGADILLQTFNQGNSGSTAKESKSISIPVASADSAGIMSSADKASLDSLRSNTHLEACVGVVDKTKAELDFDLFVAGVDVSEKSVALPLASASQAGILTASDYQKLSLFTSGTNEPFERQYETYLNFLMHSGAMLGKAVDCYPDGDEFIIEIGTCNASEQKMAGNREVVEDSVCIGIPFCGNSDWGLMSAEMYDKFCAIPDPKTIITEVELIVTEI